MGFVHDWQKKLGFKKDPFVAEPSTRVGDYLVTREREREQLNLFCIKRHRFGMIHGPAGIGKSTLLLWLRAELGREAVLCSGKATHEQFQETFLLRGFGMLGRVTKAREKLTPEQRDELVLERVGKRRLVILVDDANDLAKESKALLQRLLELPQTQVILALERVLKEYAQYGEDQLDIELKPLTRDALATLLERRLALVGGSGLFPFSKEDLQALSKAKSLTQFLEEARERAIELSLHAERPKALPQGKAEESNEAAEPAEKAEGMGKRFALKFVRRRESGITLGGRRDAPAEQEETTAQVDSSDVDVNLLNNIVEGEVKRKETVTVNNKQEEIQDVIEELVDEIGGKK